MEITCFSANVRQCNIDHMFLKNVLRKFEAEILKRFKNIQPQPKSMHSDE